MNTRNRYNAERNTGVTAAMTCTVLLLIISVAALFPAGESYAQARNDTIRGNVRLVPVETTNAKVDVSLVLRGLTEAVHKWTAMECRIDERLKLDSPRIHRYPLVYINTAKGFDLLDSETRNLGQYLENGGFVIIEFDVQSFPGLKRFLPGNARLKPVPDDHPIYSICFPIEDTIWRDKMQGGLGNRSGEFIIGPYLTGIWIDNDLVGVYSEKGLGNTWSGYYTSGQTDNTIVRLGVNFVAYAHARSNE